MARDYDDYPEEDESCLSCGEIPYTASKVPGMCKDCHDDLTQLPIHVVGTSAR